MSKIWTIYSDCHIGVPPQRCADLVNITHETVEKINAYSLGDNFELKNCENKDLSRLLTAYENHKLKFMGRFVSGNHCCAGYSNDYNLIVGDVLLTHGDLPLWGNSKAFDFRNKKRGGGFGWINKIALNNNGSISKSESKELAAYAKKNSCKVIIIGHVHPAKVFDQMVDGVRVICVPRGMTQVII